MMSMKISDYFKLVKPEYIYIKITPHKSIRNYNSSNIAKAIANTYRAVNKRIHREQKNIFFETNFKISYVIDIYDNNANFYFVVPRPFLNIIVEKIREIWAKATIEEVEPIKPFCKEAAIYELSYKKEDALSLQIDKKSNEPLNSVLSVMDIMKYEDRITIIYNFIPISQFGWLERYQQTMDKVKQKRSIDKDKDTTIYYIKVLTGGLLNLVDSIFEVLSDFTGGNQKDTKESLYMSIMGVLEQQKELSSSTKKKKDQMILGSQIAVVSESSEEVRKQNNAHSVCQAYRVIDEDNELKYKRLKDRKESINVENYSVGTKYNTMSTEEVSNFIQVPGRALLMQHKISHINVEENNIPDLLSKGNKNLGEVTYKGTKKQSYLEDDYNIGNLPLVPVGSQGSGKTTFICNYATDSQKVGEGVIALDFIKNCELSDDIKRVTPSSKLIEIDLGNAKTIQGLGYNEIQVTKNMKAFDKLNLANLQSQQIMALVDSISIGEPLSSRMRRFINSAANVVFSLGYSSIREVLNCLEDYKARERYLKQITDDLRPLLIDEIRTLEELDEYSKPTKDNPSEKIGTRESKIEHILDRISMLREDFKIKFMYNKSLDNNINLIEAMEEGKTVLIKMNEGDFPTKMQKNILVTYWISKIWLATQLRGMNQSKPLRCNVIVDEVFQAPTCMKTLEYILPQSRKFGTKFVFSTQYLKQLDSIFETLEASGSSFMLLNGSTEDDFNHFKNKFENFDYEDLRDMKQYHSMNLIKYSKGYSSFITKLPKPI